MRQLLHGILIVFMACLIPAAWFIGIGMGAMDKTSAPGAGGEVHKVAGEIERSSTISTGEIGTSVYTVEMWQDGEVVIRTGQAYINQLSEHTVLVTNRSLDDVQQEIMDCMDEVEGVGE